MSHYLPGAAGDLLLAVPPPPGLTVANTFWFQSGDVGRAVVSGQVDLGLDLDLFLNLTAASYTFERPVLGGTYTIAAMLPVGRADLSASVTRPGGGVLDRSGDRVGLSDALFVPVQLNWSFGDISLKAAQAVIAPTGGFDTSRAINLGRNYWSFDTSAALTWFDQKGGREVSIAPGLMINMENPDTDYRTGTEFHMDFTATQFLSKSFAIGLRGYWYEQLTDDSGAGAVLGGFRSRSFGLGLGFLWTPPIADGRVSITGKWMRDLDATNRFESDYAIVTIAGRF